MEGGWIKYSEENIKIGNKGKLYKWRDHTIFDVMENGITSIDVNIVAPETCVFDLQFSFMNPLPLDWHLDEFFLLAMPKKDGWGGFEDGLQVMEVVLSCRICENAAGSINGHLPSCMVGAL